VKIDIPRMLLYLRNQLVEGNDYPDQRTSKLWERYLSKCGAFILANSKLTNTFMKSASLIANIAPFVRKPFPASWKKTRESPALAKKTFVEQWASLELDSSFRKKH
jgi:hypothetical protein